VKLRFLLRNSTRFHHEHLVLVLIFENTSWLVMSGVRKYQTVTPGFKVESNAHSMCAQESSLHTYHTENGYRITNVTI
jgi:hypothetical protein